MIQLNKMSIYFTLFVLARIFHIRMLCSWTYTPPLYVF